MHSFLPVPIYHHVVHLQCVWRESLVEMVSFTLASVASACVPHMATEWLVTFCHHTGKAWGPTSAEELFWYRPPEVHIFEFVVLHLFVCCCFRVSWEYSRQAWRGMRCVSARHSTKGTENRILARILLLCWCSQVFFKAIRPNPLVQLGWLMMPCHLITLLWVFVLLRDKKSQYPLNVYLATLAADYYWAPVAAAVKPDFGDHQYLLERYVFAMHHGILLFLPFYFSTRYELLPMTTTHLLHVTAVATLINVGPYTLYSYISGLNLNYMLHPPPNMMRLFPFSSVAYRFYVIAILIILTVTSHVLIVYVSKGIRWMRATEKDRNGGSTSSRSSSSTSAGDCENGRGKRCEEDNVSKFR